MKKKISTLFICAATLAGVAVSTGAVNAAESTGSSTPATTATTTSSAATTTPSAKPAETTTSTTTADAAKTSTVTIHFYNKSTGAEIAGKTQTVTDKMGAMQDVKLQVPDGYKYEKDGGMLKVTFDLAQKSVDVYVDPVSANTATNSSSDEKSPIEKLNEKTGTGSAASTTSGDAELPATGSKSFVNVALAASGVVAMIAAAGYAIVSRFKAHKAK